MNTLENFNQSQSHGFIWENDIRQNVFKIPVKINSITKYDINQDENIYDSNENISIKTTGGNNIDCGDILRFFQNDYDDKKTTMIIIRYKQNGDNKELTYIYEIELNYHLHYTLWGSMTYDVLLDFVKKVKELPSGKIASNIIKNLHKEASRLEDEYCLNIKICVKVDSKNQRRVQFRINLQEILEYCPENIISISNEPILRGHNIKQSIYSPKRKRNIKQKITQDN